jgi:hypothetical protein
VRTHACSGLLCPSRRGTEFCDRSRPSLTNMFRAILILAEKEVRNCRDFCRDAPSRLVVKRMYCCASRALKE